MIFLIVIIAILFIILSSSVFKLHPLVGLLLAALFVGVCAGLPIEKLAETIGKGFGNLMSKIGLMVILGCIIGSILDKSGAAIKVSEVILDTFGKKNPTFAMSLIGAIVGIPVFCDSGFIILSKLNKIVAKKTNKPLGTIAIALSGGLFATHTLVPPTPGPLSAAGNLGMSHSIGLVILIGLLVSIPSLFLSTWFAGRYAKNLEIIPDNELIIDDSTQRKLPTAWLAFMPILLPIILISIASFASIIAPKHIITNVLVFLGSPLVSFLIAIFMSYSLFHKNKSKQMMDCFKSGIEHCGTTLVLVGAGGAFGAVLNETNLKEIISEWLAQNQVSGIVFLFSAFLIAIFFKTAQGSTTSSMVLTTGILAPLLFTVGFDSNIEAVLLVMAVGSGAMIVSHTNDAWFWVVAQFTGLSTKDAYKTHTILTGLQGFLSFVFVVILYLILA